MAKRARTYWPALKRVVLWGGGLVLAALIAVHLYAIALRFVPVPTTLNIVIKAFQGAKIEREWVALEAMSPHLIRAVIAAEDTGFCGHSGVSFEDIQRALAERRAGRRLRGASTLTQQTAKNVFFWNGGGFVRKAGEAWMALFIDQIWGKRRVLEVYLNIAEWGDGLYGAEAAAQHRFGKSARALSAYEASLLAAVLPSPQRYRLDPPTAYVARQAGTYRARMRTVAAQGLDACVL